MDNAVILGILRTVLAAAGGILVTKGYLDDATLQQVVGAVIAIIAAVWSVISKKSAAKTVATAAVTGLNPNTISPTATGAAGAPPVSDAPKQN